MDDLSRDDVTKLVFSDLAAVTMVPRRLTDIASWHEHIPFASWLIRQIKPARFVELGVHKGDSYSAFCQAVSEAALPTVCFGIDTWQGEQHAGVYDDSVWLEFSEYHSQHYATFSRLIRSTFEDALPYFEDGSVDLLHIDGRHFYEDVKHDFESWLPKLSQSAVVLFHDINVRERDFGVWKYWDELCANYPARTLSFVHGHGLGVLFTGSTPPALREKLCALNSNDLRYVRNAFAALGKSVARQAQVAHGLRQFESLKAKLADSEAVLTKLSASEREVAALGQQVEIDASSESALKEEIAQREREIARLSQTSAELGASLNHAIDDSAQALARKNGEIVKIQQQIDEILQSRSWRLTKPLRALRTTVHPRNPSSVIGLARRTMRFIRARKDRGLSAAVEEIRQCPEFDPKYYLEQNPDVLKHGIDPALHYLVNGWLENRDPSKAFSTDRYLSNNPDVARADMNPLLHFIRNGRKEGRQALPVTEVKVTNPVLVHQENSPDSATPAPAASGFVDRSEPMQAEVEDIRASGLFDETYYRAMYPDQRYATQDPINHYCEQGWRQGKNPSEDFDTRFYLDTYRDIAAANLNPFWHYVCAGRSEHRLSLPDYSYRFEKDISFGAVESDIQLIALFACPNWNTLRGARPVSRGLPPLSLPHEDLSFYNQHDQDVLENQVRLAKQHGLRGFCMEIEWGTGSNLIESPIKAFIALTEPDFGFCVQTELPHSEFDSDTYALLIQAVLDPRYIRVEGRPLIVLKVPAHEAQASGNAIRAFSEKLTASIDVAPFLLGRSPTGADALIASGLSRRFDAALDVADIPLPLEIGDTLPIDRAGTDTVPYSVVAQEGVIRASLTKVSAFPVIQSVTLSRDNTSRSPAHALIYTRFRLRDYRLWLDAAIEAARTTLPDDRRFIFLNSWNNWNEGLFLEPDRRGGYGRLNETTRALLGLEETKAMPKVSVIVPNYNHESYLPKRLDSIFGQTYKNLEVILLDDCSSDRSREILDRYARDFSSITRVIYNDKNSGGPFRQWAKGIKAATGDLIWIAESDDFCDDRFLEVLVRCFDDEAVLLAYANCIFVDRNAVPVKYTFKTHISELDHPEKWDRSYCETAHNEVRNALGIKNTIPNASGVLFKRPVEMPLLDDESWLSMVVAGDWLFYLQIIRGGKIAFSTEAANYFRRYEGSAAEVTYRKQIFYNEVASVSKVIALNYDVPSSVLERCRESCRALYDYHVGGSDHQFDAWYDYQGVIRAQSDRLPNVMVATMGFYPGGAEILPIRLANEFKRQGLSVVLMSAGLHVREEGIRNMVRNDVPIVETSDVPAMKRLIQEFGVEVLNTHQWHVQKYPVQLPDVFSGLKGHVASLHGMIEHGDAFGVTEEQLRSADRSVSTWVYTAEKNLDPFADVGLLDRSSGRFIKFANGMTPPEVVPVPRVNMSIPEDAFVLCCVSRAIPDKGWAEAILAVEKARTISGLDIRLILVGNGTVYDDYCQTGVPPFVYLAGFSDNSVGHYAAADMGIMLTKFKSESFPLTVVDCLFAGKPYIATDVGDIRNMLTVNGEVAGAVFSLEDWEVPIDLASEIIAGFAMNQASYKRALDLVGTAANRYRIDVVAADYLRLFCSESHSHVAS